MTTTTTSKPTRRQREVLDHLSRRGAFSREKASWLFGGDTKPAETLAAAGVLNKRYDEAQGALYWIRPEGEQATGADIAAGFVVILEDRTVQTPSGRRENFFVGRATRYDGKGTTFRRLLRGWMQRLGLRNKDLLGGTWGIEMIPGDSPVFAGDHVILED